MAQIEMLPDEKEIGHWTLNYIPASGGRYTGPLTVTNQRLLFDAQFNTSAPGALRELMVFKGTWGYIAIPKSRIRKVDVSSSMLKKKVVAVETVDHPSDGQVLAYARKHFRASDQMRGT